MNNKYILFRHGESVTNLNSIICSTLENGTKTEFGLTQLGIDQVNKSAKELSTELINQEVIIFSSPFTRTIHSSLILKEILNVKNTNYFVSMNLVERGFSQFELMSSDNYQTVWKADKRGNDMSGIEPCDIVQNRIYDLFQDIEDNYSGKTIIFVSHGDTIMIGRTLFLSDNPYSHRDYPFIKNAEFLLFELAK